MILKAISYIRKIDNLSTLRTKSVLCMSNVIIGFQNELNLEQRSISIQVIQK